ncbi:MAG: ATP-binding protein [Sedimentisphaerales bacterium]|jgi:signal transduction histidine kinase/HAMP domain-containing protein|nr:ATP-binding protein [Sedimentisphaerales bacterium]HNY77873.1 ATP-binding protein [Sedimentisphaerales bacterium]HOC63078.1 ATP-binding protein [Sedimentisphaerales bacterium]HOH64048.1 ATP-binding protein [Sedimentisphaerales bacterium]HQA88093.1 ATP-binding protein [Sedimentisphaerales bacterium]
MPTNEKGHGEGVAQSWMRGLSLRHKLIAIIMTTSVGALLLAGGVFTAWEWTSLRRAMVRDLSTHADILADNCKAALAFEDTADANEVLGAMKSMPSIRTTCLYTSTGRLLAVYRRDLTVAIPRHEQLPDRHVFRDGLLILARPIQLDDEHVGTICIASSLGPVHAQLRHGIIIMIGIILVASLGAYLISSRLQGAISSPILSLACLANFVSEKKQYTVRAEPHGSDEVGLLVQAFNEMLEQIQQRDSALVEANEQLEGRVAERTMELTAANEKLLREVAFRKRAEQVLKQRAERIVHHQRTLVKLSKHSNEDLVSVIRTTTEEAAATLGIDRVSVWFLDDGQTYLVCEDLFRRDDNTHKSGTRIATGDHPSYVQAIENSRIVAVNDVRQDPRTRELLASYLEPLGIRALMDVPIHLHGKTLGVVCHEHVGAPREWSLEEQDFAASLADMIALQMEASERRKAERALASVNEHLAETVRELRRSNKELQDFAYVTAHDLKAPLRGIGTLTDWITSDYADKLDTQGQEQLHLLKGRVSRMSELIDSILHYSEIGRTAKCLERVDLRVLVPEVIAQVAPPPTIRVTIEDTLPVVISERVRLIQVFQNLISNAVKYMDKPEGTIRIGCFEQEQYWTFSVADNGPGIDQKYFGKIFEMFQTLARRDELESTGIGLAVVKKIVELHGGTVWIESTVGEGSTFFFTLPKLNVASAQSTRSMNVQN